MNKVKDADTDFLFEGILSLETVDECYDFFKDLCTVPEIKEMSKRFHAAKMLSDGASTRDVTAECGFSSATVSRVNQCIKYGNDGYKTVLDRLKEKVSD